MSFMANASDSVAVDTAGQVEHIIEHAVASPTGVLSKGKKRHNE